MAFRREIATAPALEPWTLSEVKAHLRVDHSDEDTLITTLIKVARQMIEKDYDAALISQTIDFYLDSFPQAEKPNNPLGAIEPIVFPVISVTSITYTDTDVNPIVWDASNYTLDTTSNPARIVPAYDKSYPDTRSVINAVTIKCVCGFGAVGTDVPEPIRHAMLLSITMWYENKEDMPIKDNSSSLRFNRASKLLLDNYFQFRL